MLQLPFFRLKLSLTLLCSTLAAWTTAQADDSVTRWNGFLREVMKRDSDHVNPGYSTRAMAMMNGAIYDSFQAIRRTHRPFHVDTTASPTASRQAAAAAAGYRISKEMYPSSTYFLTWSYRNQVDPIPESADKAAGIALGEAVADAWLAWRATDGSDSSAPYTLNPGPGHWRPAPGIFPIQNAWGPEWGAVDTFCLTDSQQFQPPRAPALTSATYTAAFEEVRLYGAADSAVRSLEQLYIGQFWAYDRSGIGPPPVLYNKNIHEIVKQLGTGEEANARLFTMASIAMADAAICGWDCKFIDDMWRPITGIREADTDGNPATQKDEEWEPYGAPGGGLIPNFTPPFPSYVSGHAVMGQAAFQSLKRFFGVDNIAYTLTSDEVPGMVRSYGTFTQAAQENADSRVWLGVHWRFDQTEGQALGEDIADYVAGQAFQPLLETYPDFAGSHAVSPTGTGDKDKDGLTDFAEYAFNTNPRQSDVPPGAVVETISGVPCLVLRYTCQPSRTAAGLALVPQMSYDLTTWTPQGVTDEIDPDRTSTTVLQCRRACIPVAAGPPVFLRLKAQL